MAAPCAGVAAAVPETALLLTHITRLHESLGELDDAAIFVDAQCHPVNGRPAATI